LERLGELGGGLIPKFRARVAGSAGEFSAEVYSFLGQPIQN